MEIIAKGKIGMRDNKGVIDFASKMPASFTLNGQPM